MKKRPNGPRNLKAGGFTNGLWRLEERERKLKMTKLPDFEENRRKWERRIEERRKEEAREWKKGVQGLSKVEAAKAELKAEAEAKAEARKKLREPIWGPREPNLYWKKQRLAQKEADEAALRRTAAWNKAWDKGEGK